MTVLAVRRVVVKRAALALMSVSADTADTAVQSGT
jgi:hypothetical protein